MQRNSKKQVTTALIERFVNTAQQADDNEDINFSKLLIEHGSALNFVDVDFSGLSNNVMEIIKRCGVFEGCTFTNCNLTGKVFEKCTFIDCKFIDSGYGMRVSNNLFICDNDEDERKLRAKLDGDHFGWRANTNNYFKNTNDQKPTLAVVYEPNHGTYYTDRMAHFLNERGINIIRLYCTDFEFSDANPSTPNHPIFSHIDYIDGLLLPGGDNVETDPQKYSDREKTEAFLVELSLKHKIPLLGVCRGHQFVGHYFGAKVADVTEHIDDRIYILPEKSSLLSELANKKLETQETKSKKRELFKISDVLSYNSNCAHRQGLFFNGNPDKRLKITAQSLDGLPESLQVEKHIITFQHHHEADQSASLPRAVIKMFANMIKNFKTSKVEPEPAHGHHMFHKREAKKSLQDTRKVKSARVVAETASPNRRRGH